MSQLSFDFPPAGATAPLSSTPRPARRRPAAPSSPTTRGKAASAAPATPATPLTAADAPAAADADKASAIHEARLWQADGWSAGIVEQEDGWAVELRQHGDAEPVLISPWPAGRDGTQPRPLDQSAFSGLVKRAAEQLQRQAQQWQARLHKSVTVRAGNRLWSIRLDIVPDEYEAHAVLIALDDDSVQHARLRVRPDFPLTTASAKAWIEDDFRSPERDDGA